MDNGIVDYLGRKELINNLIKIIDNSYDKLSFALCGKWGIGKTFVLDKLEEELIKKNNTERPYLILKYNCWEYDYYDEPLLAIVSSMGESLNDKIYNLLDEAVRASLSGAFDIMMAMLDSVNNVLPVSPSKLVDSYASRREKRKKQKRFDYNDKFKKAIKILKNELNKVSKENKIIFMIDELDRCLPEYAIKVLERLHHIFEDVSNSILIFSVDKKQLDNTVKNIFGNDVEVDSYLKKFIDFEVHLSNSNTCPRLHDLCPDYCKLFDIKEDTNDIDILSIVSIIMNNIPVREVKKIFEKAKNIHKLVCKYDVCDYSLMLAEILYLVYKKHDSDLFDKIKSNVMYPNYKSAIIEQLTNYIKSQNNGMIIDYTKLQGTIGKTQWIVLNEQECTEINANGYQTRFGFANATGNNLKKEISYYKKFIGYCDLIS